MDCNFPHIKYEQGKTNYEWGFSHGEAFREAIKELAQIRKELMLKKNPKLINSLDSLALEQFNITKKYVPHLCEEMQGIADGAKLSLTDIIILNNYTDFRDIELPEEGCSTIAFNNKTNKMNIYGQTWDMHRSAKNYLCVIEVPTKTGNSLTLSLVGCLALMGVGPQGQFVGVNNINTKNAKCGIIWPAFVRQLMEQDNYDQMMQVIENSEVTSGHNYLLGDSLNGAHVEVTPDFFDICSVINSSDSDLKFHTNHCLGVNVEKLEMKDSLSSTTFNRFEILTNEKERITNSEQLNTLLKSHIGYPKSICSHYESGALDPSFTCGGGIFEPIIVNNKVSASLRMWRGCPHEDGEKYIEYFYNLKDGKFTKV